MIKLHDVCKSIFPSTYCIAVLCKSCGIRLAYCVPEVRKGVRTPSTRTMFLTPGFARDFLAAGLAVDFAAAWTIGVELKHLAKSGKKNNSRLRIKKHC